MTPDFSQIVKDKNDAELKELLINEKDYDKELIVLAEQEFITRQLDMESVIEIRRLKNEKELQELQSGKKGSSLYLLLCFAIALAAGPIGIFSGYIYGFSKVKGSDGNKYPVYEPETRKYGKIIFFTGIASLMYVIANR